MATTSQQQILQFWQSPTTQQQIMETYTKQLKITRTIEEGEPGTTGYVPVVKVVSPTGETQYQIQTSENQLVKEVYMSEPKLIKTEQQQISGENKTIQTYSQEPIFAKVEYFNPYREYFYSMKPHEQLFGALVSFWKNPVGFIFSIPQHTEELIGKEALTAKVTSAPEYIGGYTKWPKRICVQSGGDKILKSIEYPEEIAQLIDGYKKIFLKKNGLLNGLLWKKEEEKPDFDTLVIAEHNLYTIRELIESKNRNNWSEIKNDIIFLRNEICKQLINNYNVNPIEERKKIENRPIEKLKWIEKSGLKKYCFEEIF
jgi:hypothetical protein